MATNVTPFGKMPDQRVVERLTLAAGDLAVSVLTLGAILQDVRLAGVPYGLTLGSDLLADYLGPMAWFGSIVGPVANRIAGARAVIGGRESRFEANQAGRHALHSGAASTCFKLWEVVGQGADFVLLGVTLPDGEGGFPGNRRVTARYTVSAPATLTLDITTMTDAATIVNLTSHAYWNLDGTETWAGHALRIAADGVVAVDDELIPTGVVDPVAGTGLDLRAGPVIHPGAPVMDTNFCVGMARGVLRDVLWLRGRSGVAMTLATTEPGVQIYDGAAVSRPGRGAYEGLAIEAQGWPDAPSQPSFPTIGLAAGESVAQVTRWSFSRR